jgi:ATP-dependent DNA helicase UvrD/PcrA
VLEHYRQRFEHILVDEYQDTNRAQNAIVLMLAGGHGNVTVVGDTDQCLPAGTSIRTPRGDVPVESIRVGDHVLGTTGRSEPALGTVTHVHRSSTPGPFVNVTAQAEGQSFELRATPHHIVPARLVAVPGAHFVSLTYRADRGYRVGRTTEPPPHDAGHPCAGHLVRSNQEHADAVWLLRTCSSLAEASYFESYYSTRYGLPTARFPSVGRPTAMDDAWLAKLYDDLDTTTAAKTLMEDLLIHSDFPHHRPQHRTSRSTIDLTMFGDVRGGRAYHRVQWSSNRPDVAIRLRESGVKVRAAKGNAVRYETSWKEYRRALDDTKRVAAAGGLSVHRRLAVGGTIFDLMPLSHVRPGMELLVDRGGALVPATVTSCEIDEHAAAVWDLEVDSTHTYVANGVLVHNSVYRFRGADFRNIIDFEAAFDENDAQGPGSVTTVVLDQNYRSTQTILDAANAVIANNAERRPKHLWTDVGPGDRIVRFHAEDEHDEARFVAATAHDLRNSDAMNWREMAVLYRTNAQSRVVEEAFMRLGVPYKVVGGTRYYDRREIRDAIAYLRVVVNPVDEVSVKRVLNVPKRGVGDTSVAKLDRYAAESGRGFFDALRHADEAGVSGPASRGVQSFVALIDSLIQRASGGPPAELTVGADPDADAEPDEGSGAAEVLQAALEGSGYLAELEAEDTIESAGRIENLDELVGSARQFARIDEFLQQVALVADTDDIPDGEVEDQVVLMTLHSAKGLEFPVVFLIGAEEGIFPSSRAFDDPDELEEERRLAYVGITRARQRLLITHAWSRSLFGSTQYNPPSRFVEEIPDDLIETKGNVTGRSSYGRQSLRARDRRFSTPAPYERRRGKWNEDADDERTDAHRDRVVEAALAAGRRTTAEPSGASGLGLRIGDDVEHPSFGEGVVLELRGSGDSLEATVNFRGVGMKHLALAWAPLAKLG